MADTTYQGVQMRTVIGWMAALFASALLGAAVYQTVLSKPAASLDPAATVETVTGEPGPQPTTYRTEVRTIVEPTPTVTVEEEVLIAEDVSAGTQVQPAAPAPTRTSSPRATPRATAEREDDNSTQSRDDDDDRASTEAEDDAEDAAKEAEDRAEDDAKEAEDAAEAAAKESESDDD